MASRKSLRNAFTRSVSRSAAWTLFFLPQIVRRQHLPRHRQAHGRAAAAHQRRLQLGQGHVRLLAYPGHHLRLRRRVEFGRRTAGVGPRRDRARGPLSP